MKRLSLFEGLGVLFFGLLYVLLSNLVDVGETVGPD
jgi:hypothetical protein